MRPFISLRLISALMLATAITSCGGGDSDPVDPGDTTVGSVAVSPGTVTLSSLGATSQLTASATSTSGASVPGTTFTWTSSNTAVATVDGSGLVTAVANGTTTVTATASGSSASGSANVAVAQTAASIAITSPSATVTAGQTVQLSATVEDAGGSALTSPALTWSSSDTELATVDAAGLVSALRSGAVTITASQDGASGTSGLTVVRGDFIPTADATLGGVLEVATLTVAAGVTITLTADVVIDAQGPVTIAGDVLGDCMGLSLNGQADLTISGTFSNACSVTSADEEPPALVILGAGTVNLDGATVTSSGDITIGNATPSAAAAAPGRSAAAGALVLSLDGTTVMHDPMFAPSGLDGLIPGPGQDGHGIFIQPGDLVVFNGTLLQAQNGGAGGSMSLEGTTETTIARGAPGGAGGSIDVIQIELVSLSLLSVEPLGAVIHAGDGAAGGMGTSTTLPNPDGSLPPDAEGSGGAGADGGNAFNVDSFFDVFTTIEINGPVDSNPGNGGPGGAGFSVVTNAGPGEDILMGEPGTATATGAPGGHAGSGPIGSGWGTGPAAGGPGGVADATAINGADGDDVIGFGQHGGDALVGGGPGGHGFGMPGAPGGDGFLRGGNAGNAAPNCPVIDPFAFDGTIVVILDTDFSDFFMLNTGFTGIPIQLSGLNVGEGGGPGFPGGNGGDLLGAPGPGGFDMLNPGSFGPPGTLFVDNAGNGGDMGRGLSPGNGGMAGSGPAGPFTGTGDIFTDGFESGDVSAWSCSVPAPPAGTAGMAAVTQAMPGMFTLNGTGDWVTVTGPIAEDGTITAQGMGTVAGTPDISVAFSGTFDQQAGTLVGEYSMDTGSVISPGHPVIYGLDMTVTPPAAADGGSEGSR